MRILSAFVKLIAEELEKLKIRRNLELVTIGKNSKIYSEASVGNISKNKSQIVIGKNTHIRGQLHNLWSEGKIEIGDYCFVGEGARIWAAEHVKIGNRVMIAHGVNIHDNISHPIDSEERHQDYKRILGLEKIEYNVKKVNAKPIFIEDDVWIGFNSIIMKGVTIARGAVIGAGSLITHDIPEYCVVVGNPQRIVRKLK